MRYDKYPVNVLTEDSKSMNIYVCTNKRQQGTGGEKHEMDMYRRRRRLTPCKVEGRSGVKPRCFFAWSKAVKGEKLSRIAA